MSHFRIFEKNLNRRLDVNVLNYSAGQGALVGCFEHAD
jgi:hypothetical protein